MLLVSLGKKEKEIKKQQVSAAPKKNGKQCDVDVLVFKVSWLGSARTSSTHTAGMLFKSVCLTRSSWSIPMQSVISELTPPEVWTVF